MTIRDSAENAHDMLGRALLALPGALAMLHDHQAGYGGNRRPDPIGRSAMRSVLYCDRHQRDLDECQAAFDGGGGELCAGIPVAVHSDPTGDAATANASGQPDPATGTLRRIGHLVGQLERHADALVAELARLQRHEPSAHERKRAEVENATRDTRGCCEVCARHMREGKQPPPAEGLPTDNGGELDREHVLCKWHRRFVRTWGRLPTPPEERRHQLGRRIYISEAERLRRSQVLGYLVERTA